MKLMNLKSVRVCSLVAAALLLAPGVSAMSIGLDNVLGWVDPDTSANTINELGRINYLIGEYNDGESDLLLDSVTGGIGTPTDKSNKDYSYFLVNGSGIPAPTLDLAAGPGTENTSADPSMDPGFEWIMAKYGNLGVVFYVGDQSDPYDLPSKAEVSGENQLAFGSGQGLSHATGFGETNLVPDGGATLALLGMALAGMTVVRRWKK